jgi:hypothetical protein
MNFDPSADFANVIDGTEPVTLQRRGVLPGGVGEVVAHALRGALSVREVQRSNGRYTVGDVAWRLPCGELAEAPELGDLIIDGGSRRWTILDVQCLVQGAAWRCITHEVELAYGLDDTISILKAIYSKSGGGAAEATWRAWKTGIRARIQPLASEVVADQSTRRTAARFHVFLAEGAALDHTHRIQGPDGTIYRILRVTGVEQLGELQTVEVESI